MTSVPGSTSLRYSCICRSGKVLRPNRPSPRRHKFSATCLSFTQVGMIHKAMLGSRDGCPINKDSCTIVAAFCCLPNRCSTERVFHNHCLLGCSKNAHNYGSTYSNFRKPPLLQPTKVSCINSHHGGEGQTWLGA